MCNLENRLFVYGTLAPGQSAHHFLEDLQGTWQAGTIAGTLYPDGVGPTAGYPAVDLAQADACVEGSLLTSEQLPQYWERLDAYEGEGYRRVRVLVSVAGDGQVEAYVYALDRDVLNK